MKRINVTEIVREMVEVLDPENAAAIMEDELFQGQVAILQMSFDINDQVRIAIHSKNIGEMIAEFPHRIKIEL